ncbi:MAG TPA: NAD-dependent epimerase/dehydratase family protein, partial [Chthonomonadaceae bacterium]|nr:NAD-dependent epimerase/dehydratase family protein [Chthonomonadaceae bacterium]
MRTLVTGATGFLGGCLARALLARGDSVVALGRDAARCAALARAGAEVVRADLRDSAAVSAACMGIDRVCHAGALSAPWGRRAEFQETNVVGTANVIAGCAAHDVRRLVYVSSPSAVFDGRDHAGVTERAPYPKRFASAYSESKKLAEDLVNAERDAGAGRLETVIVRPKAVFGPGDTSLLPRLLAAARRGRLPQIGSGANRVDLTYVDNVADALISALDSPASAGNT